MLALAAEFDDSGPFALPLCDSTALGLAAVLVNEDRGARVRELREILSVDPAFAVWVCCWGFRQADSIRALAEFLDDHLSRRLQQHLLEARVFSAEQNARFAALVAESVAEAQEVNRLLGGNDASAPQILAALCSRGADWLDASADGEDRTDMPPPVWPAKLAQNVSPSAESRRRR